MPKVNSSILQWARKTAGLTPEEAVQKLMIKEARGVAALDRLVALEDGSTEPTRNMLVKMSGLYKRPLITFYLAEIPIKGDRGEDYRTLPEVLDNRDVALVDAVVRDLRARQELVRAALIDADEAEQLSFVGSKSSKDSVSDIVKVISKAIDFDRETFRSKQTQQAAFAYLRQKAEELGIFVVMIDNLGSHHTTISVEAFRGFALADNFAPFVAINANDSPGAWSFTLLHELTHIWLGETGLSGQISETEVEKLCNDVASEFLVSQSEVARIRVTSETSVQEIMQSISDFASDRKVSSTMIAYKLYRAGIFDFSMFQILKKAYRQKFKDAKAAQKAKAAESKNGPSYYITKKHRTGASLINFAERMMHEGNLSVTKAGKVLGVGAHNVHTLIQDAKPKFAV